MNDSPSNIAETLANVAGLTLLAGCLYFWLRRWRVGPAETGTSPLTSQDAWSAGWLDLLLVLWCGVMLHFGIAMGIIRFVFPAGFDPAIESMDGLETSWYTILYSSSIQLAMLLTLLGARYAYKLRFFRSGVSTSPSLIALDRLLRYLPLIWAASLLSIWVNEQLGISSGEQEAVTLMQRIEDPWKFLALATLAIVAAPLLEELLFRGIVLRFLIGQTSCRVALIVSSLLFALLHFNLDSFLPIAVLGFLLGKIYLDTGDLRTSIWMHTFFNTQSVLVLTLSRWVE
ncbi:MAG: CPBP family intramembrane glutamic endopeptidase [Puniceicoccaceae bacterium]